MKALVLAHPSPDVSQSADRRIKAMFLPKNTTSLIQPMDQGVISAFKRGHQCKYLAKVLVVLETESDRLDETRGKRTLKTYKTIT